MILKWYGEVGVDIQCKLFVLWGIHPRSSSVTEFSLIVVGQQLSGTNKTFKFVYFVLGGCRRLRACVRSQALHKRHCIMISLEARSLRWSSWRTSAIMISSCRQRTGRKEAHLILEDRPESCN